MPLTSRCVASHPPGDEQPQPAKQQRSDQPQANFQGFLYMPVVHINSLRSRGSGTGPRADPTPDPDPRSPILQHAVPLGVLAL
jgi:hypothetical protein